MYDGHRALNNKMARVVFLGWLKIFHFENELNYIFDQAFHFTDEYFLTISIFR